MQWGNSSKRSPTTTANISSSLERNYDSDTNKENAQNTSRFQRFSTTKSNFSVSAMKSSACTKKLSGKGFRGAGGDCPPFLFYPDPSPLQLAKVSTQETTLVNEIIDEQTLLNFESHFKWISIYSLSREQMIKYRDRVEICKEETIHTELLYCHKMSMHLEQLMLDISIGNKNGQQDAVNNLDLALSAFPEDLPVEQYIAYLYLFLIQKCYIMFRNNDQKGSKELLKTIKGMDISIPRTHATILAVKATFLGLLGVTEEKLNVIKQVIDIDPDFSEWYTFLYSTLRRCRRERDFTTTPTDEEVNACRKALDLNPNLPMTFQKMAVLFEDILRAHQCSGHSNKLLDEKGHEEMSREMIWFARKACELNPNCIEANVKLAEMLNSRGMEKHWRDSDASEKQFIYCLKKWPKSSHVLHIVGKFYIREKNDLKKGLNLWKQALESCSDNYPCLMDYLRELFAQSCNVQNGYFNEVQFEEFIEILDDKIPLFKLRNVLCGRLKCFKAAVWWKLKLEDKALDVWLEALNHDPNLIKDDVVAVMSGSTIFKNMLNVVDFESILDKLKAKLTTHSKQIEEEIYQHIQLLTEAIQKDLEDWHLFQNKNLNNPNWRQSSSRQKVEQRKFNRQMRYISECDAEVDWRSHCGSNSSSVSDTSSVISTSSNYPRYSNHSDSRKQDRQGQVESKWQIAGNKHHRSASNLDGAGDGYGLSNLRCSRDYYGSNTSISTMQTQASCSSVGSSYSRNYGFRPPFNRNKLKSKCDIDENWRRK